jgi:electron transfer flavoprotein beta subunit
MKIVVTVKQVPDPGGAGRLTGENRLDRSGDVVLDPGDEYGVEAALQVKDKVAGTEVVAVSMSPERGSEAIRKALSMGVDRAIHICDPTLAGADALNTARVIAAVVKSEAPDLVILAPESTDGSTGMVPPMVAELLGLPQLTFAKFLDVAEGRVTVHRQTANGYQVIEAALPALVTVTAAIGSPRYASLKGIMAARSKEIRRLTLGDLGLELSSAPEAVVDVVAAEQRAAGEVFQDDGTAAERIVAFLQTAKVI